MILYVTISLLNVFLHIFRSILVIKAGKLLASTANCITYTFSAVVVKYISENSLLTAIVVAAVTNFIGCWLAMWLYEHLEQLGLSWIKPINYLQNESVSCLPAESGAQREPEESGTDTDEQRL